MLEKSFAQIIGEYSVSIPNEYNKLYNLFYKDIAHKENVNTYTEKHLTLYDLVSSRFLSYPFRKTILTIDEFDKTFGFDFVYNDYSKDINRLVLFIEYVYNLAYYTLTGTVYERSGKFVQDHICCLLNEIHYRIQMNENQFFIVVPNDFEVLSACAAVPEEDSMLILKYTHHSTQSDVGYKKRVLLRIYEILEPERYKLNSKLTDIFFPYSNSCNIRHNNVGDGPKHKEYVSKMDDSQLIELYDNLFKVGLILLLEKNNLEVIDKLASEKGEACK